MTIVVHNRIGKVPLESNLGTIVTAEQTSLLQKLIIEC